MPVTSWKNSVEVGPPAGTLPLGLNSMARPLVPGTGIRTADDCPTAYGTIPDGGSSDPALPVFASSPTVTPLINDDQDIHFELETVPDYFRSNHAGANRRISVTGICLAGAVRLDGPPPRIIPRRIGIEPMPPLKGISARITLDRLPNREGFDGPRHPEGSCVRRLA